MIVVCELQNGGSFLLGCDNDIILDCKKWYARCNFR
nr:MAG TPA: hypothetical protein [Caudoviricetes sp.]